MNNKLRLLAERIEAENVLFLSMSKAQQRVVIAKDCIERIELEQIKPDKGRFFGNLEKFQDSYENKSIQETLNTCGDMPSCEVCAKGGLFLSVVGRVNKLNFDDIHAGNGILSRTHEKLLEFFTVKQLALIEYAFEGEQHIRKDLNDEWIEFSDRTETRVSNFYDRFISSDRSHDEDVKARLIGICENIIRNNGTFKL